MYYFRLQNLQMVNMICSLPCVHICCIVKVSGPDAKPDQVRTQEGNPFAAVQKVKRDNRDKYPGRERSGCRQKVYRGAGSSVLGDRYPVS